jgi:putative transposase
MPRIARIVGIGYLHHVVQRGNNKEKVFLDKEDHEKYLSLLEHYSKEKEAVILAYCLMPNHVHLLIRPLEEETLSKMMQGITLCYTQYFNRKNSRTGRLWECRYHSTVIEEDRYLWAVGRYIESNPVRAGLVKKPEYYLYSSAKTHILGVNNPLLKESLFDKTESNEYRRLMKIDDKVILEDIRRQTRLGRPLGNRGFLETLSAKLDRSLVFRPKGRPRKKND